MTKIQKYKNIQKYEKQKSQKYLMWKYKNKKTQI